MKIRSLKVIRWSLVGSLILFGGVSVWVGTDRLVAGILERYRSQIQEELSKPLGHPLKIGPYKGLRPWGIAIGSTQLLSGELDDSTANFSGLTVKIAPIASLFNWRPVAILKPEGARVNLRSNENGSYWVSGSNKGKSVPNFDLRVLLDEPARVFIEPVNVELTARTKTTFHLSQRKVAGFIQLGFPNRGSVFLKGKGYWDRLELKARARLNKFKLEPLIGIFPKQIDLKAKGKLDGDLQLSLGDGQVACKGGLNLVDFMIKGGPLTDSLSSDKAAITCSDTLLQIPVSKWEYGSWVASVSGDLPLNKTGQLNLGVSSSLGLKNVSSSDLKIEGNLPLIFQKGKINPGELTADLTLSPLPLAPIGSLIGTSMSGSISGKGQVKGPLNSLRTNLSIGVVNPQLSGIRLQEEWRGDFAGDPGGGGRLKMTSVGAAVPGNLSAVLAKNWALDDLTINRLGGRIYVKGTQDIYRWEAEGFRLDRVEVAIPPEKSFKRIFGELGGQGSFGMSPLAMEGQVTMRYPRLMGLQLKEAQLNGRFFDNNYSFTGKLFPPDTGQLSFVANGLVGGGLSARAEAKGVSSRWLTFTALQLPKINLDAPFPTGNARDLGEIFVETFGESLDGRLKALALSQSSLRKDQQLNRKAKIINPDDLRGQVDAVIKLEGPDLGKLNLDLKVSGKLLPKGINDQFSIGLEPFVATLKGPLQGGKGEFSLLNLPFSLLSLVAPIPSSLKGTFGLSGRYRLGKETPEITADLILKDALVAEEQIVLERGKVIVQDSFLKMDVVLRSKSSRQPVKMIGQVPMKPALPMNVRVESHGDGLRFLDGFSNGAVSWKEGSADLRLLIRGTISDPEANGFLVLNKGEFEVMEKAVKDVEGTMLFDFNRLEVKRLKANIGSKGTLQGVGAIALFRPGVEEKETLTINMNKVPLKLPIANVEVASNLELKGALLQPRIGGEVTIKEGSISPQRSGSGRKLLDSDSNSLSSSGAVKRSQLPEQRWDLKSPLVLFVQDEEAPASKMLRASMPTSFSAISFENLRLRLGPNLRITSQPVATFNVSGLVTLNGAFDQSLKPRGVIRLKNGRVNLFTTTFDLDKSEPNVAVFTPSLGLIPFVDVTMTSSVPDTVRDASNLASSSDFASNGSGAFGIGGSRFVKVEVTATGPADRLSDNFQLRSTPPMPESQLLGLIGGNSLTRLLGGGEREVLANLLGRSVVSTVLGNITGAFSEKLKLSLYSAYVTSPKVADEDSDSQPSNSDEASGQLSPQQAWVTEMGIDLTKRFNFSVQATPNRKDIPPQGTLTFQVNPNIGLLGSLDNNGTLKSQVQLFLRF